MALDDRFYHLSAGVAEDHRKKHGNHGKIPPIGRKEISAVEDSHTEGHCYDEEEYSTREVGDVHSGIH